MQDQSRRSRRARQNGQNKSEPAPQNELEIYRDAIDSSDVDEFLDSVNLGLGKVSDAEFYQNVESYHKGLFADAAFSRLVEERALEENREETKRTLALDQWEGLTDEERRGIAVREAGSAWEELGEERRVEVREEWIERVGELIWREMTPRERRLEVVKKTGAPAEWTPPHLRMLAMRHDHSGSKDAHLLDNVFGRVTETVQDVGESAAERLKNVR